jgi:phosphatidylglycerol:prolipoprotein diacylglycerol transferase
VIGGNKMTSISNLESDQIVFPKLGIDVTIHDTAFSIFGIDIKWYGLLITIGMLLAMIYGFSQMKKYGIDPDRAIDAVIGGIIGGLVGARVYYVIMSWDTYSGDWKSMFNIRNGGLAIYGGVIGAVIVGGLVAKWRKVKLLPLLDIVSIGFLLGQGIGRWGNFTNQEAFGYNTDNVFGMTGGRIKQWIVENTSTMTGDSKILEMTADKPVHPCFLYESVWCLVGFVVLALLAKKIRKFDGQIFLIYIGWYGLGRFFIEGLRTDSLMIGTMRVSQVLAAICVIASIILQIVFLSKVKRMGEDYQLYCNTEESKQLLKEAEERSKAEKTSEKNENVNTEEKNNDSEEEQNDSSDEETPITESEDE